MISGMTIRGSVDYTSASSSKVVLIAVAATLANGRDDPVFGLFRELDELEAAVVKLFTAPNCCCGCLGLFPVGFSILNRRKVEERSHQIEKAAVLGCSFKKKRRKNKICCLH